MAEQLSYSIYPLGDTALLVNFGAIISEGINRKVMHVFHTLKALAIPYVTDVVPAFNSLAVYYNILEVPCDRISDATIFETVAQKMEEILLNTGQPEKQQYRELKIPVCYADKFAPDMELMVREKGLTRDEIICLHTATAYTVFMLGFLPGFAYMGTVAEILQMPRKEEPRQKIDKGSIGIAGLQTGIYPMDSPGGWQIIGRTPVTIFNKHDANPAYFQPGDKVHFYSITENEFEHY